MSARAASTSVVAKSRHLLSSLTTTTSRRSVLYTNAAVDRYSFIRFYFRHATPAPPAPIPNIPSLGPATRRSTILTTTLLRRPYATQQTPDATKDAPTEPSKTPNEPKPPDGHTSRPHDYENYSPFYKNLALALPHLHRPTRDDFLNVATGFWQRVRIHFKWITVRSFRRFNADDISAFITWFLMSQTLWIFVGTSVVVDFFACRSLICAYRTTFFSVIFSTANSLQLQSGPLSLLSIYRLIIIQATLLVR